MNPRVRIDPFHLRNGAAEFHLFVAVEFGRKRVMRPDWYCRDQKAETCY
jgi:hypothetical protein